MVALLEMKSVVYLFKSEHRIHTTYEVQTRNIFSLIWSNAGSEQIAMECRKSNFPKNKKAHTPTEPTKFTPNYSKCQFMMSFSMSSAFLSLPFAIYKPTYIFFPLSHDQGQPPKLPKDRIKKQTNKVKGMCTKQRNIPNFCTATVARLMCARIGNGPNWWQMWKHHYPTPKGFM